MKKLNKQLLSEELEKFKLINEYNFYVGEELETADDLLLDEDDEEEVSDPLADEIDDLPADDSKSNSGDEESEDDLDIDSLEADIDTDEEGDIDSLEADIEGEEGGELDLDMESEPAEDEVELDVTELVSGTEEAKQSADMANQKIDQLLGMVDNLESQLSSMSSISNKIDSLENELEKRAPTPEEKIEMRSLDSYPYNLKLTDFWADKDGQYDVMGSNDEVEDKEFVLTQKDVDDSYSQGEIKNSFDENPYEEEDI